MRKVFFILLMALLLLGCSPTEAQIQDAIDKTQATQPTITHTPKPTATNTKTETQAPTPTLEPISTKKSSEPLEIYLLADEGIKGGDLKQHGLEDLRLAEEPSIRTDDILEYDWDNHGITLTDESYQKVMDKFTTDMSLAGRPFVILSYGERIYAGAFWSLLSSMSFDGVTIMHPMNVEDHQLQITLGYPTEAYFSGEDPRDDPRIQQALEDVDLLVK